MRRPVAAKMAFVTAGATEAVAASPKPPGSAVLATIWVSRRFIDAQRRIRVKVALLDSAVLDRYRAAQRSRESEDRSALYLCVDHLGLTGNPQSTAQTIRSTLTFPFSSTATSATCER